MHWRTNGVYVELKLVSLIEETVDTGLRDVTHDTLIVIGMMAVEMFGLFSFLDSVLTRPAGLLSTKACDSMYIILS